MNIRHTAEAPCSICTGTVFRPPHETASEFLTINL
jgi:hypothetical protein